jgi:anti-sigma factor RsiW
MSDIHALSCAYAVDALDDIERAEFERHLATCSACRDEVESLRETTAHLAESSATAPPPDLRSRILDEARSVRPLPPSVVTHRHRARRVPAIAAAAALIVGLGAGVTTALWKPWQSDTVQLTMADRIRQASDAQTWTQRLPGGGTATVTRSRAVDAAVWESRGLASVPAGRVYELWLQTPDESLAPAGLMSSGDGEVILRGDAGDAIGAGLTVEPSGGSPAPTTEPLVFFDFRQS